MTQISREVQEAIRQLRSLELDPQNGLPQEIFLLVSSLVPLVNADLLVVNEKNQLLLSRRNDGYFEKSWHIPGGCMRMYESFSQCIHTTALRELGCDVTFTEQPIAVRNIVRGPNLKLEHPNERGHNVAVLFRCSLPAGYVIDNGEKGPDDDGFLRWFDALPPDFLKIQMAYADVLSDWMKEN